MSEKPATFKCTFPNCNKFYSSKYNLSRHLESSHSKHKRFRCRLCGKCLSSKQNLQEHRYTHSKVKPYICSEPLCGKKFRQSSQLSNHRKLHKELLLISRRQREFKELKVTAIQLTCIFHNEQACIQEEIPTKKLENFVLPKISAPQTLVVLPGMTAFSLGPEDKWI